VVPRVSPFFPYPPPPPLDPPPPYLIGFFNDNRGLFWQPSSVRSSPPVFAGGYTGFLPSYFFLRLAFAEMIPSRCLPADNGLFLPPYLVHVDGGETGANPRFLCLGLFSSSRPCSHGARNAFFRALNDFRGSGLSFRPFHGGVSLTGPVLHPAHARCATDQGDSPSATFLFSFQQQSLSCSGLGALPFFPSVDHGRLFWGPPP